MVPRQDIQGETGNLTLRVKFFLTCAALALVLFCTIYTARVTTADWQNLQQQTALVKAKDVRTIRPWMSLSYIARTYQVPENYLIAALKLPHPKDPRLSHETLDTLSFQTKRPVNVLLLQTQNAIISYRKPHTTPGKGHIFPPPQSNLEQQDCLLACVAGREEL